jgi:hypothetical protein
VVDGLSPSLLSRQLYHSSAKPPPLPFSWALSSSFFDNNNNNNDDSNQQPNRDDATSRFSTTTTRSTSMNTAVNPTKNAFVGGLVREMDIMKSQLFAAFTNLDLTDQYDAVLTGMCAKLLDKEDETLDETTEEEEKREENYYQNRLQDCRALLQEMTKSRIVASPRSIMALIDVSIQKMNE